MTQQTPALRTGGTGTDAHPVEPGPTADPVRRPAGEVSLDRLLTVAVLSSTQATFVAARLLEAAQVHGATDGPHPGADSRRWAVAITPAGEVEVAPAPTELGGGVRLTELLEVDDDAVVQGAHGREPHRTATQQVACLLPDQQGTHPTHARF